jgi:hypothetical protein
MLHTAEARFARLFLRRSSSQAGAIDMQLAQLAPPQVYGPPAPAPPSPAQVIPQKPPAPGAQTPIVATPPASGLSTTTMVVIGVAAFGAVYLIMRKRAA